MINGMTEGNEFGLFKNRSQILQFHTETVVGLVTAVNIHGFLPGNALERQRNFNALDIHHHLVQHLFHDLQELVFIQEGTFDVHLGEVGLSVRTQVFVTEASGDLVVAFKAGDHQQLLVQLGRLGQSVEGSGMNSGGNQEVSGAFRSGTAQNRGFDIQEAVLIQEFADGTGNGCAHHQAVLHDWTAQVQIAVFHTGVFQSVSFIRNDQGSDLGGVDHVKVFHNDFNVTGRQSGVLVLSFCHCTGYLQDVFLTHILQPVVEAFIEHKLHDAGAVAQVDEVHGTEVSLFGNPAHQGHFFTGVGQAQCPVVICSFHNSVTCFLLILHDHDGDDHGVRLHPHLH